MREMESNLEHQNHFLNSRVIGEEREYAFIMMK